MDLLHSIDNMSALQMMNDNISPIEHMHHLDMRYVIIQDWRKVEDIIMEHIHGILNPSNDMTKPFGYVLYVIRHYQSQKIIDH